MPDRVAQVFGSPTPRVDGVAKVTGVARFASDETVNHPAFAYLVTSSIARGRIGSFNLERTKAVPLSKAPSKRRVLSIFDFTIFAIRRRRLWRERAPANNSSRQSLLEVRRRFPLRAHRGHGRKGVA